MKTYTTIKLYSSALIASLLQWPECFKIINWKVLALLILTYLSVGLPEFDLFFVTSPIFLLIASYPCPLAAPLFCSPCMLDRVFRNKKQYCFLFWLTPRSVFLIWSFFQIFKILKTFCDKWNSNGIIIKFYITWGDRIERTLTNFGFLCGNWFGWTRLALKRFGMIVATLNSHFGLTCEIFFLYTKDNE